MVKTIFFVPLSPSTIDPSLIAITGNTGVLVGVAVAVGFRVAVAVGFRVAVAVGFRVAVAVGFRVSVAVGSNVSVLSLIHI